MAMQTFRQVIDRWPSRPAFAAEVGERPATVRLWVHRNNIPPKKLRVVADAAERAGFDDITYAVLTEISKRAAS